MKTCTLQSFNGLHLCVPLKYPRFEIKGYILIVLMMTLMLGYGQCDESQGSGITSNPLVGNGSMVLIKVHSPSGAHEDILTYTLVPASGRLLLPGLSVEFDCRMTLDSLQVLIAREYSQIDKFKDSTIIVGSDVSWTDVEVRGEVEHAGELRLAKKPLSLMRLLGYCKPKPSADCSKVVVRRESKSYIVDTKLYIVERKNRSVDEELERIVEMLKDGDSIFVPPKEVDAGDGHINGSSSVLQKIGQ